MSEIVERLRDHATDWNGEQMVDREPAKGEPTAGLLRSAAARIERLEAALRDIESNWEVPMEEKGWRALARFMWETARAALGGSDE